MIKYYILIPLIIIFIYEIARVKSIIDTVQYSISGLWQAHPSFCDESEIDMFCIYFSDCDKNPNMCWILMIKDDELITNHFTEYNLSVKMKCVNLSTDIRSPRYFILKFKELPENMNDHFLNEQDIIIYPFTNKIILMKDNKVYFVGYRDNKISDLIDIEETFNYKDKLSEEII